MRTSEKHSCDNKKKYHTRKLAQKDVDRLMKTKVIEADKAYPMNAYLCRHCGSYHMGHTPKSNGLKRLKPQLTPVDKLPPELR